MELIDRAKVERITFQEPSYSDPINVLTEVRDKVRALPTVDAEPVRHGHWIKPDDWCVRPFWERYICSECLCHSWNSAYCPSCGAKMERGER